jgi:hypothetical protein
MNEDTHAEDAEKLRARMEGLKAEVSALLGKLGLHEQMRVAHEDLRAALLARVEAEVAYLDLRMLRRDEWQAVGFGPTPINDAGDCAASAAHVRAEWNHEQADMRYRQIEVAWLEWVAGGADSPQEPDHPVSDSGE